MANALLYYRTLSTKIADVADPDNLPAGQKLSFTAPDDHANGIEEVWTNNISRKTPVKPLGRKILQTDEGVTGWNITINGSWTVGTGDADTKLNLFRRLAQSDTHHIFGVFGIKYPNGPAYLNIDPSATLGLMITGTRGRHVGSSNKILDFSCGLSFGGDVS